MVVGRSPSSFSLIWPLRYTEPRTNCPNWNRKLLCLLPILESCLIRTSKSYFKRSFSLTFPRYSEGTAAESTRLLYPRRCASFWQRVCVTSSWQLRGSDLWLHYEGITFFWADVKNSSWGAVSYLAVVVAPLPPLMFIIFFESTCSFLLIFMTLGTPYTFGLVRVLSHTVTVSLCFITNWPQMLQKFLIDFHTIPNMSQGLDSIVREFPTRSDDSFHMDDSSLMPINLTES